MPTIEDTILLATEAHKGQTDKAGLSYILHPLRVMSSFLLPEEEDARMVAILHDVVEDTHVNLGILTAHGYSRVVIEAVDALTRMTDESYENYIQRVAKNPLASRVKVADLSDNLNEKRVSTGMLSAQIKNRYRDAKHFLIRGAGGSLPQP